MSLNAFAATLRLRLFEDIKGGSDPSVGSFNAAILAEGRLKGTPQMGSTRYEPSALVFEFIFPDNVTVATVFTVTVDAPERIVFLPVPGWVIESIWQGEIDGSYHFESDALELVESFRRDLAADSNLAWFQKRQAKRRE